MPYFNKNLLKKENVYIFYNVGIYRNINIYYYLFQLFSRLNTISFFISIKSAREDFKFY